MPMIKTFSAAGWEHDVPVAASVKIASGRLTGRDRLDFVKRAAGSENVFLDAIDGIKWAADEEPVHLIALGASEKYGQNRNGDAFPESALKKYHDTFVKFAMWYRSHKNKDPRVSYGVVKASAYNPRMHRVELLVGLNKTAAAAARNKGLVADREMEKIAKGESIAVSMACPLVGTPVRLKDCWKPVEDVVPGDEVLTHRGRYRRVYATLRREKPEYVRIKTKYFGREVLEFTPEHEFYVARWQDVPGIDKKEYRHLRPRYRDQLHAHARWIPCGQLTKDDLLLLPIDRGVGSSLTKADARLMGYYTAEGSVTSDGYLCFTCNISDEAVHELPTLANCSFNKHSASDQAYNVNVYDKVLTEKISGPIGRGVRNKRVPEIVRHAATDIKLEFLGAWFNGDGFQDVKGLHWSTCSRTLAVDLLMLLASVGVPASIYRIDHTSDLPDRARETPGIEYTVNVSNRYSGLFAARSKAKVMRTPQPKTTTFVTGDFLAIPVREVVLVKKSADVCDLSVEEDESFNAMGVAVHNCRVPEDYCSACGHAAKTRDEYCTADMCKAGGCRDNLTKLVKIGSDYHVMHVINRDPIFFDISNVHKPADRIAYADRADWIDKTAADLYEKTGGAGLAETLGLYAPVDVVAASYRHRPDSDEIEARLKLAYALAGLERDEDPDFRRAAAGAFGDRPPLDLAGLGLASPEKRASALAALCDASVVVPLGDFARMTGREAFAGESGVLMKSAYSKAVSDGTVERMAASPAYAPAPGVADDRDLAKAAALRPGYGVDAASVRRRAAFASPEKTADHKPAFVGRPSGEAVKLAEDYAAYQLAALVRIAARDAEFALTARLGLCQNQNIR